MIHSIAVYLGTLIGGVTFTGSLVAFGKLQVKLYSLKWIYYVGNYEF